jgi:hypothetical protein
MRTQRKITASGVNDAKSKASVTIIGRTMSLMNRHETRMRRNRKFPNEPKNLADNSWQ